MRTKVVAGVVVMAAMCWGRLVTGQVQAVPGPGTGIVTVQGEVDIRRMPPMAVMQGGQWKVSLEGASDVRVVAPVAIAPLPFIRAGVRYVVTWPAGDTETVTVAETGGGAWVRAGGPGRARWVNLAVAKGVEEAP